MRGFPRTGYFIPVRDGMGAWQISGVIHVRVYVFLTFAFLRFSEVFKVLALFYLKSALLG